MTQEAIEKWKEKDICEMGDIEQAVSAALDLLEINTLRDLLATKIKANDVAKERFIVLQHMKAQMEKQAEDIIKQLNQHSTVDTSKQESFNKLGQFCQKEYHWIKAHPIIESNDKVTEQWRMDHTDSAKLDQALESYRITYGMSTFASIEQVNP